MSFRSNRESKFDILIAAWIPSVSFFDLCNCEISNLDEFKLFHLPNSSCKCAISLRSEHSKKLNHELSMTCIVTVVCSGNFLNWARKKNAKQLWIYRKERELLTPDYYNTIKMARLTYRRSLKLVSSRDRPKEPPPKAWTYAATKTCGSRYRQTRLEIGWTSIFVMSTCRWDDVV